MSSFRTVRLRWAGEGLVFHGGGENGPEVTVDSDSAEGAAPMELLLLSVAGCMGVDVVNILQKSRVPLDSMVIEARGERAESEPRKYESIQLRYVLSGPGEEHQTRVQRAIDLSRDKYCSVLHTLDPTIELDIQVERA